MVKTNLIRVQEDAAPAVIGSILDFLDPDESVRIAYQSSYYVCTFDREQIFDEFSLDEFSIFQIEFFDNDSWLKIV
jgi:hypothetical protein